MTDATIAKIAKRCRNLRAVCIEKCPLVTDDSYFMLAEKWWAQLEISSSLQPIKSAVFQQPIHHIRRYDDSVAPPISWREVGTIRFLILQSFLCPKVRIAVSVRTTVPVKNTLLEPVSMWEVEVRMLASGEGRVKGSPLFVCGKIPQSSLCVRRQTKCSFGHYKATPWTRDNTKQSENLK